MRRLGQFIVILSISFIGEVLNRVIPLPIPGSIYGMILMFIGLSTGLVPLKNVRETGYFLIEVMPVMFIPAAVGLIDSWGMLKEMLLPAVLCIAVVTFIVMGVSGHVTQWTIRHTKGHETVRKEKEQ